MAEKREPRFPDGIDDSHSRPLKGLHPYASPLAFVLLGGLLSLAMLGLLGGAPATKVIVDEPAASMAVKLARPLRSGLFFETRIHVVARQDIAKPTIGIDAVLWRDLTINSQVPSATDETFTDGQYRFSYSALQAGETLEIKIDGQTNPPLVGRLAGAITLLDHDVRLAETHLSVLVLP